MDTSRLSAAELTQISNIEKQTGRKMADWIAVVNQSGLQKHGELVNLLKEKYGFTHGNANMVVHWAKQSFAGVTDADELVEAAYKGKENLRPWYEHLMAEIKKFGTDVELAPKKGYMSLRRKKQFALIQPSSKTRLDIGLNMKGIPPSGIVEDGKKWNAMCTHRIRIEEESALTPEVISWIRKAYDQAG
jgi:predicted transport protein